MEPATIQRKLTTIVLADIAGYSRLMSRDEEDTHARCASLSRELVEPAIAAHGGLLVKKTGDGFRRAVRRDGGDRVRDLVQQGADLGGVVFVAVGQGGGHDPASLGVHAEMELPPRPAPLGAVLLDPPRARAVELQPRAVDQQVHGAGIAASAALRTVAA